MMPMLAYDWDNHRLKVRYPVLVQPKVNGVRAIWDGSQLHARPRPGSDVGHQIVSVPWVDALLRVYFNQVPADGEVFCRQLTFEEISGQARLRAKEADPRMELWLFDLPRPFLPCRDRILELGRRMGQLDKLHDGNSRLVLVPTHEARNEVEVDGWFRAFLDEGWEGVIVRDPLAEYQPRRTRSLLKLRPWIYALAEVVGTFGGKGKYEGMLGGFHCRLDVVLGTEPPSRKPPSVRAQCAFDVGTGFSDDQRGYMMKDENLPGQMVKVRFRNTTSLGNPQHPVFVSFPAWEDLERG